MIDIDNLEQLHEAARAVSSNVKDDNDESLIHVEVHPLRMDWNALRAALAAKGEA